MTSTKLSPLSDSDANILLDDWKSTFPDAMIFGTPSQTDGVVIITHTLGLGTLRVNGLASKSPILNNPMFSSEVVGDKYLHLYNVMIPDIPSTNGGRSTAQMYINYLRDSGLDVAGINQSCSGATMTIKGIQYPLISVHHQHTGAMSYREFARRTRLSLSQFLRLFANHIPGIPVESKTVALPISKNIKVEFVDDTHISPHISPYIPPQHGVSNHHQQVHVPLPEKLLDIRAEHLSEKTVGLPDHIDMDFQSQLPKYQARNKRQSKSERN